MEIVEYIILAVAVILALWFIIRVIVKIIKGEDSCLSCCNKDKKEESSSCSCHKENDKKEL